MENSLCFKIRHQTVLQSDLYGGICVCNKSCPVLTAYHASGTVVSTSYTLSHLVFLASCWDEYYYIPYVKYEKQGEKAEHWDLELNLKKWRKCRPPRHYSFFHLWSTVVPGVQSGMCLSPSWIGQRSNLNSHLQQLPMPGGQMEVFSQDPDTVANWCWCHYSWCGWFRGWLRNRIW